MSKHNVGDKKWFKEHFCILKDLDSMNQMACLVFVIISDEKFQETAVRFAQATEEYKLMKSTGNKIEIEYGGETGHIVNCEKYVVRTAWRAVGTVTNRNPDFDIDNYLKLE